LAKFLQELIRRYKEGIPLKNAADDHHGMSSHDVNHRVSPKTAEMVGTNNRVVVPKPYVIDTRLELNHVIDVRSILGCPVHAATNAAQRKSSLGVSAGQLFKHLQHPILIETAIWKVDFGVGPKLELSILLCGHRVDACSSQALEMVLALLRVQDVNRLVPRPQPVLYERKQDAILFFVVVKERANVTRFAELGAGKRNGCWDALQGRFSYRNIV
jgi:hypothetical protein